MAPVWAGLNQEAASNLRHQPWADLMQAAAGVKQEAASNLNHQLPARLDEQAASDLKQEAASGVKQEAASGLKRQAMSGVSAQYDVPIGRGRPLGWRGVLALSQRTRPVSDRATSARVHAT